MNDSIYFFAGTASQVIATRLAELSNRRLAKWELIKFSDGELRPILQEDVKGAIVVLIQSTYPPIQHMFELLLMIDAAKHAGADKIVVVTPYLGYMRQDKIHAHGQSYGASLVGKLLSAAGADELIVCNPHARNLQLLFDGIVKQVSSFSICRKYVEDLGLSNMCFVAPDSGALEEAKLYADYFNAKLISCVKIRNKPNQVKEIKITDSVENLDAILIDDIIDTGNTLVAVANQLKKQGASSVRALCTHPVFSENSFERLINSHLAEIVVTNTIPLKYTSEKIQVIDIAPLILEAINR